MRMRVGAIVGVAIGVVAAGCSRTMAAATPPSAAELGCTGADQPIAVERDRDAEVFKWRCGRGLSCPEGTEVFWSSGAEQDSEIQATCRFRCKAGEVRTGGACLPRGEVGRGTSAAVGSKASPAPMPSGSSVPSAPLPEDDDPLAGVQPVALGAQEARILAAALPLTADDIDFDRIDKFFALYAPIVAARPPASRSPIVAAMKQVRAAMREVTALAGVRNVRIGSGITIETFWASVQLKSYTATYPVLSALTVVVARTTAVINDFHSTCRGTNSICGFGDNERNLINYQIGPGTSYSYDNVTDLQRLIGAFRANASK